MLGEKEREKLMYDNLIEKLRCCVEQIRCGDCRYVKDCDGDRMMMSEAADAIEELSNAGSIYGKAWTLGYDAGRDENKPQWISVTERLPEPDKTDSNGFAVQYLVMNGWRKAVARRTDKYWVLFGTSIVLEYVTHWMPLPPEPPKEE